MDSTRGAKWIVVSRLIGRICSQMGQNSAALWHFSTLTFLQWMDTSIARLAAKKIQISLIPQMSIQLLLMTAHPSCGTCMWFCIIIILRGVSQLAYFSPFISKRRKTWSIERKDDSIVLIFATDFSFLRGKFILLTSLKKKGKRRSLHNPILLCTLHESYKNRRFFSQTDVEWFL